MDQASPENEYFYVGGEFIGPDILRLYFACRCSPPGPHERLQLGFRLPAQALVPEAASAFARDWPDFGAEAGEPTATFTSLGLPGVWMINVAATTTWVDGPDGSCAVRPVWPGNLLTFGTVDVRVLRPGTHRIELFEPPDTPELGYCNTVTGEVDGLSLPLFGGSAYVPELPFE
jgi:hypothetical protein